MLTLAQAQAISASRLNGLNPIVRQAAEELIVRTYNTGVPIVITQGLRTIAYQDQLYAQGRTAPGKIVTNAKGGQSFHNFGLAIDFALLMPDGRAVSWGTYRDGDKDGQRDWLEVASIGKGLGFEWGGDWKSFLDLPHFQMTFGLSTAQLRSGAQPPTRIKQEEDQLMTDAERQALNDLTKRVECLEERITAPAWFVKEFGSADLCGKIHDPHLTAEGWRVLAIGLRVK